MRAGMGRAERAQMKKRVGWKPWALVGAVASVMASAAMAQNPATPGASGAGVGRVVHLAASASTEVAQDWLTVVLQAQRDGVQAAAVHTALKQVMGDALQAAKAQARAGAMEVQTGQYIISPRYGDDGKVVGWSGRAEVVLQGTDIERISQTAGALNRLQPVSMNYAVSRSLREKHESTLTQEAVLRFRQRADEIAKAFGAQGAEVQEVHVDAVSEEGAERPVPVMAMRSLKVADAAAPLPTQGGKSTLRVQVQGSVRLLP